MSFNKKKKNIIINFDIKNGNIKILSNYGNDINSAIVENYSFEDNIFSKNSFSEILDKVLESYVLNKSIEQVDAYFVLPDNFVFTEYIKIPIMNSIKMKELLKSELVRMLQNYSELAIKSSQSFKNKKNITYRCLIVKKNVIHDCINICKKHGLNIKNISYSSNAFVNSFLALNNKNKHFPCILVDIQSNCSKFLYVYRDKLIYSYDLPFGYLDLEKNDFLSKNYVGAEYVSFGSKAIFQAKNDSDGFVAENILFDDFAEDLKIKRKKINDLVYSIDSNHNGEFNFDKFIDFIEKMKDDIVEREGIIPEFVVVNIPQEYKKFIEYSNSSLKIYYIDDVLIKKSNIKEFFDLYGMIYASTFNREQNFVDKEKGNFIGKVNIGFSKFFTNFENSVKSVFKKK